MTYLPAKGFSFRECRRAEKLACGVGLVLEFLQSLVALQICDRKSCICDSDGHDRKTHGML
jgi:hypothetical protein